MSDTLSFQLAGKSYSFEQLVELSTDNPEHLQTLFDAEIENVINSAPAERQRRLRGLQFQIDMEKQKHDNPMGACVAISRMMMESVKDLDAVLKGQRSIEPDVTHSAQCIDLQTARESKLTPE